MPKVEEKAAKQDRPFKTPEQIDAATKAMAKALKDGTADAIVQVWKEHLMNVGHKVLGRLLIGRSPKRNGNAK